MRSKATIPKFAIFLHIHDQSLEIFAPVRPSSDTQTALLLRPRALATTSQTTLAPFEEELFLGRIKELA